MYVQRKIQWEKKEKFLFFIFILILRCKIRILNFGNTKPNLLGAIKLENKQYY